MLPSLDAIRPCLEGAIPSLVATCAPDGTPNVSYVSQVHYMDPQHVALSYQFFNKTRQNVLANPHATAHLIDPRTAARYRLRIEYLRTESSGPLFESMKAKLAGIASHTGMSGIFRLLGSDVYRVHHIEHTLGVELPLAEPRRNVLAAVRATTDAMSACTDLSRLIDTTLDMLEAQLGIQHAAVLIMEVRRKRLFTVASRGFQNSGVGSEVPLGAGVIGVAARERTPIRISYATAEYAYSRAIREAALAGGMADLIEMGIPLPGLIDSQSQLAVPILARNAPLGVLFVDSAQMARFSYDDEDALMAIAAHLGALMAFMQADESVDEPARVPDPTQVNGPPLVLRHYARDESIFIGNDYLIKGVAGAILWKLACDHVRENRSEFTNRELRLDPRIRLPDIGDNLEARLVLLAKRLSERSAAMRIERTGRGRFRLAVQRPLELVEMPA